MRFVRWVSLCALTVGLVGAAALPVSAAEKEKKPRDPAKIFSRRDADGDGKVTLEEFKAGMKEPALAKAEQRFKKIDADGNGTVSLEEFTEAMKVVRKKNK